ncbi:MAG: hypothetical protein ACO263_10900 [Cyclobacteriaceae bacterium]
MKSTILIILLGSVLALNGQAINGSLQAIGMDGKYVNISADGVQGAVVFFTSTRCPYDEHYLDRMKSYAARFSGKIRFYFVNSSAEDTPEEIRKKSDEWASGIPYLHDADQSVFRSLAAKRTSEVFFLQKTSAGLQIMYRGPLDDNPQVSEDADHNFLLDAIQASLNGQKPPQVTARVAGCFIRTKY